ncbi:hypothetical protein L917_14607 [Phytophthora nicotianae]|uniref:Uncharacterized protein n=3 Tax=Phytophthora nicotianae TaxID=4792 RepID=V9EYA1_PHYNI|nr:hypothetical protein F443_11050 [Phytophthora nicotianae P1569]ETL85912.1 hypothetical protein L917_14607 [Phytophthora nicotianae]ETO58627.1 hypothetical protein F444_22995 [Phytophthora nicotianae P1976]
MAGKNTPEVVPVKWSKWNNVLAKVLEFVLPHPEGKLLYHGSGRLQFSANLFGRSKKNISWSLYFKGSIMPTLAVIGNAC